MILLPPRDWLHARCDARFEAIFSDAGIEEVRHLLARHLPALAPVMRAIGVREIAAFLHGETSREAAMAAGKIATRQYAKRQYTWFRRQPPADWPRFEEALEGEAFARALASSLAPYLCRGGMETEPAFEREGLGVSQDQASENPPPTPPSPPARNV